MEEFQRCSTEPPLAFGFEMFNPHYVISAAAAALLLVLLHFLVVGSSTDAAAVPPLGSLPADRSSLFLCMFCSRNAHLCDPYYACYPGTAGAGPQQAAVVAVSE